MAAAAFGAQFAAQSFASFAAPTRSGACDSGQPTPGERQRRSDSPTLAELRAAAEAGTPLVREETPDSDLEREEEAEAERIRIAAEEEAARCLTPISPPQPPMSLSLTYPRPCRRPVAFTRHDRFPAITPATQIV